MENSIAYFYEVSTKVFEKLIKEFYKDPKDFASFVTGIDQELHRFGIQLLKETLEEMDDGIRTSGQRKQDWVIDKKFNRELVTSLGTVNFERTHFRNKKNPTQFSFLLDRMLGLEEREHFTEDAKARMLEEAVETSYRRGGDAVNPAGDASKESVMNVSHGLQFPEDDWEKPEEKRQVEYLYIEADEDHVHLQFRETKGDLGKEDGFKNNTIEPKLIYVHEGLRKEAPESKRYSLIHPRYFSRVTEGDGTRKLWNEVYRYISDTYDVDHVKKIYLNSDGGGWILMARKELYGLTHVLDEFHLDKCLTKLTSHMLDSQGDARDELRKAIRHGTKKDFQQILGQLKGYLPESRNTDAFDRTAEYILSNWMAAKVRLCHKDGVVGSSTEGHVYHVLSKRMSTNPMGWSVVRTGKMCQLRAYHQNHGKMLELVRYQRQAMEKAAGAEDEVFPSVREILNSEKKAHTDLEKYYDTYQHSISGQAAKQFYLQEQISLLL